jgi:undecaprenyl-diphosphatase
LIFQRPRPFVYLDPLQRGIDPAHYTSFYSGHTSFAAAMGVSVLILLWKRKVPLPFLAVLVVFIQVLVFSTGYFRIMAGRHFLTDVIVGGIAGAVTALCVLQVHFSLFTRKLKLRVST